MYRYIDAYIHGLLGIDVSKKRLKDSAVRRKPGYFEVSILKRFPLARLLGRDLFFKPGKENRWLQETVDDPHFLHFLVEGNKCGIGGSTIE